MGISAKIHKIDDSYHYLSPLKEEVLRIRNSHEGKRQNSDRSFKKVMKKCEYNWLIPITIWPKE